MHGEDDGSDDYKRSPDLHHSQGVQISNVLAGVEPEAGFDDVISIWMALVTERERLKHIIAMKQTFEPMFGVPTSARQLNDAEIADITKKLKRVEQLTTIAMDRSKQLGAVFAESKCGVCLDGKAPCPVIDPPNTKQWTCLACGKIVGEP